MSGPAYSGELAQAASSALASDPWTNYKGLGIDLRDPMVRWNYFNDAGTGDGDSAHDDAEGGDEFEEQADADDNISSKDLQHGGVRGHMQKTTAHGGKSSDIQVWVCDSCYAKPVELAGKANQLATQKAGSVRPGTLDQMTTVNSVAQGPAHPVFDTSNVRFNPNNQPTQIHF